MQAFTPVDYYPPPFMVRTMVNGTSLLKVILLHPKDTTPAPNFRDPAFFQRLYQRDQRQGTKQWKATDLMECPTCGRVIQVPIKEGGGRRPHCGHSEGWHPLFEKMHGPEIRPPQEVE